MNSSYYCGFYSQYSIPCDLFFLGIPFFFYFYRNVHGQTLCVLSETTARVRHAGNQREHSGGDTLSDRVLQLQHRPPREIHPLLCTQELSQCHRAHASGLRNGSGT